MQRRGIIQIAPRDAIAMVVPGQIALETRQFIEL
jgi:hypothetical protein